MVVKYTKTAQTDVEDIFEYIATEANEAIADRVVDRIVKICEFLGEYSE